MKRITSLLVAVLLIGCVAACKADEIPPISVPPIPVSPVPVGTITLLEGWNLIAMPVLPGKPVSVEDFMEMVNGHALPSDDHVPPSEWMGRWSVLAFAVYKDNRFHMYPRLDGATYFMVPGEAYFVYARYNGIVYNGPGAIPVSTSIDILGKPVDVTVSLNLNRGWNGVALMKQNTLIPYDPIPEPIEPPVPLPLGDIRDISSGTPPQELLPGRHAFYTLNELSRQLTEQGIDAKRIIFWNAIGQNWEEYELPFTGQDDKLIREDEGFFLFCESNGLYVPDLELNFPPDHDVGFVGKIESVPIPLPPAPDRPFRYRMGNLFMEAANYEIEIDLAEAASEDAEHVVWGTFHGYYAPDNSPRGVLTVRQVNPAFIPVDPQRG